MSVNTKFVPPFQEKEVDKYFLHFEKITTSLDWPQDAWMLLLQSFLVGKAQEVYSGMSIEQSSQYNHVKTAILKAYELVPEAYRQNFRNYKKGEKQTYTEFAREKEALFTLLEKWQEKKLEFKACVPVNIKTYIDEQKATTLQQAAVLADDYSLMHRGAFHSPNVGAGSFVGGKDKSFTSLNPPRQTLAIIETKLIKGPQEDHVQ